MMHSGVTLRLGHLLPLGAYGASGNLTGLHAVTLSGTISSTQYINNRSFYRESPEADM
jgi:hypothetical protein